MVITELYIRSFGKFKERHFYLRNGVQVISGENEFGKTTLHAFIRAMLFGLERGRGRAAATDDFSRYEPWEDPAHYAGVMRFMCGNKNFRLERNFARSMKQAYLVCEDDGEELSVGDGDLEMLLGGIRPGLFDSTVSVGQLRSEPGTDLAEALENHAANYYETGGGEFDLSTAMKILKEKKKETARELREEESACSAERERLLQECRYLERDMQRLSEEADDIKGVESYLTERERTLCKPLLAGGTAALIPGLSGLLWCFLRGWQTGDGGYLFPAAGAGILAAAGLAMLVIGIKKRSAGRARQEQEISEACRRREWELERIRQEYREKEILREDRKEQYEETGKSDRTIRLEKRYHALELAEERMHKAAEETGARTAQAVDERASEIFSAITGGRYTKIDTERGRQITVWDGTRRIPAYRLSRGTLEQIWFSMRMASADVLLEESLPLLLDDVFAFYDDKRLESVLKWLSIQKKQVIIFTCHKREEKLLNSLQK